MPRGAKPKQYPNELVARVKRLYESGMTQSEIAEATNLSQKIIFNVMRRHNIKTRVPYKRNQQGNSNHMWKGDKASYTALHFRVENQLGKPSHCDECGSSDPNKRYEWANLTGKYDDISDYKRMCVGCHRRYDNQRRKVTGKLTSTRTKRSA